MKNCRGNLLTIKEEIRKLFEEFFVEYDAEEYFNKVVNDIKKLSRYYKEYFSKPEIIAYNVRCSVMDTIEDTYETPYSSALGEAVNSLIEKYMKKGKITREELKELKSLYKGEGKKFNEMLDFAQSIISDFWKHETANIKNNVKTYVLSKICYTYVDNFKCKNFSFVEDKLMDIFEELIDQMNLEKEANISIPDINGTNKKDIGGIEP